VNPLTVTPPVEAIVAPSSVSGPLTMTRPAPETVPAFTDIEVAVSWPATSRLPNVTPFDTRLTSCAVDRPRPRLSLAPGVTARFVKLVILRAKLLPAGRVIVLAKFPMLTLTVSFGTWPEFQL